MVEFLYWFVFFGTLATVAFAWGVFLANLDKPSPNVEEYEKFEDRMLQLMGQFRHLSAVRLQMLEKKMDEMRKLIQQANSLYAVLSCQESKVLAKNLGIEETFQKDQKQDEVISDIEEKVETNKETEKTQENSLEKKILLLYQEGKSEAQIAKELGIGIGEVMLILSLFRFRTDLR
ncbi:DUF6115 domain-containing protein [Pseudothermotoga thermarum]|nr:hypothetical protein [Pseudothermotoga thermarum]